MRVLLTILFLFIASPALAQAAYFTADTGDGVAVVAGTSKARMIEEGHLSRNATDEEYYEFVRKGSDVCAEHTCELMPEGWLPPHDRRLREAWQKLPPTEEGNFTDVGDKVRGIGIDMDKARGIWKDEMTNAATVEASRLDAAVKEADVTGDVAAKTESQQKRDALNGVIAREQSKLEAASTPEDLLAVWPTELEAKEPAAPTEADVEEIRAQIEGLNSERVKP